MAKSSSLIFIAVIVLGLCSFTAFASNLKNQDTTLFYNIFKDWSSKYSKNYGVEEMAVRFYNWKSNYDLVQEHNAKETDFQLEMNHFADMTSEEFSALSLGLNLDLNANNNKNDKKNADIKPQNQTKNATKNATSKNSSQSNKSANALPKSVDWRTAGAVSSVRNQGSCGGCWSFSTAGALEGLHAIKNKKLVSFSVQQLIDCSGDYGNQGCDGGLLTTTFAYTQRHGIEPETGYEYTAEVGNCKQNPKRVAFRNNGFEEVTVNSTEALKAAVAKQPVSVGIEASSLTVQLFKSGVITSGCSTALDHAVLVVGYDVTKSGQGYWIVKNSWGPNWGLNGFFHIAMGSQNGGAGTCGINMMASYPTL